MKDSTQIWKEVPHTDGLLYASDKGQIWTDSYTLKRKTDGRIQNMKPRHRKLTLGLNGYYHFRFKKKLYYVHRCVALAHLGVPEDDQITVNHVDGNKMNNNVENLEWATYSDNNKHAYKTGLKKPVVIRGVESAASKLNDEQIRLIKDNAKLPKGDRVTQIELAERFGVTQAAISCVVTGKNWGYLDE